MPVLEYAYFPRQKQKEVLCVFSQTRAASPVHSALSQEPGHALYEPIVATDELFSIHRFAAETLGGLACNRFQATSALTRGRTEPGALGAATV